MVDATLLVCKYNNMPKVTRQNATHHPREGVDAYYYQLPNIDGGTTVAYAEFTGEHGVRTAGERARIYYVLEGKGEIEIDGEKLEMNPEDVIAIPPHATYNLWPTDGILKVILYLELLDVSKLPK